MRIPNIELIDFHRLPVEVSHWEEAIRSKIREAYLAIDGHGVAAPGATKTTGHPDVPLDRKAEFPIPATFDRTPAEGDAFIGQINLATVPVGTLPEGCPPEGIVWVFLDASGTPAARCLYDPRPVEDIVFVPTMLPGQAMLYQTVQTLPYATRKTLPDLYWDEGARDAYNLFAKKVSHYSWHSGFQLGGWIHPQHGDVDAAQKAHIAAFTHLEFGEEGVVYLQYVDHEFVTNVEG